MGLAIGGRQACDRSPLVYIRDRDAVLTASNARSLYGHDSDVTRVGGCSGWEY